MIAFLKGRIIAKDLNSIVILVRDIGYRVFCGENFLAGLIIGENAEIITYQHFTETGADLYGFPSQADLDVFTLLLGVSGVGPKSAIGVLSKASGAEVSEAILRGDDQLLITVTGIGKKTAARIVLELKNKIAKLPANQDFDSESLQISSDEIEALIALGYSLSEARLALSAVSKEISDSGERVKAALRKMKNS